LFREVLTDATIDGPDGLGAAALEPAMYTKSIRRLIALVNAKRTQRSATATLLDLSRATSHGMRRGAVSDFYKIMNNFPGATDLLQMASFFRFRNVSSMLRYIELDEDTLTDHCNICNFY